MEKSTRKKVLIIGSILVIGGVVGYLVWKHKQDASTTPNPDEAKDPNKDSKGNSGSGDVKKPVTEVKAPKVVIKDVKPANTTTSDNSKFVSTIDLLAGGINSANRKKIYSGIGTVVFNMSGAVALRPKNGTYLGVVYKSQKTTDGKDYLLSIVGTNGVKYKVAAKGTAIKM